MTDQSLHSPLNPHFFKPLLPDFHIHLDIPVTFFSRHLRGSNNHHKTAKLRSDASDKTWRVKIDGMKLTEGWEDFATAHDLRIGDIIIFRHEGEMVFHVTPLGPSCCEIQYTSSPSHNINDDSDDARTNNVVSNSPKEKRVKKTPRKKGESSPDNSRFEAHVTYSSLKRDRLYIPSSFARSNGLNQMGGKKIVLLNEEGRRWVLKLKYYTSARNTYATHGWRCFCQENGFKSGDFYKFKLVGTAEKPVLALCPRDSDCGNSLSPNPCSRK